LDRQSGNGPHSFLDRRARIERKQMSKTRVAWAGLIEVLAEAGERFAGEEWMVAVRR